MTMPDCSNMIANDAIATIGIWLILILIVLLIILFWILSGAIIAHIRYGSGSCNYLNGENHFSDFLYYGPRCFSKYFVKENICRLLWPKPLFKFNS